MSQILDTSATIALFRHCYRWHKRLGQRINCIYQYSWICRSAERVWGKIKVCFSYSFLGKISEIRQVPTGGVIVLGNSRVAQYLMRFYKRWQKWVSHYLNNSLTVARTENIKEQFNFHFVKTASAVAIVAVAVNIFFCLISKKPIYLWEWFIRGLFLFLAAGGLFCETDWPTVKRSSIFLKKKRVD